MGVYDYSALMGVMRSRHISQGELAHSIGISETSMNKKLNGYSQFKQNEIRAILSFLDIDIKEVFHYFFCKQTCENAS